VTRNEIIENLEGVICPVVTPFNKRGDIDEGAFRENIVKLTGIGLAGVLVAGSTGEAPYLTEKERLRLVELAREIVKAPELVLVGTGLEGTRATLELSRESIARGGDALMVLTPSYFKPQMNSDALVAHFRAVAAGVKSPVLFYYIPQYTGLVVDLATILKISRLPNIVGLKESSGSLELVRAILKKVRPNFRVLVGAVSIFYEALLSGAVGGVLGQAHFAPSLCVGLYEAYLEERPQEALELQKRLLPLATKVAGPYGVPGIKAALDAFGGHGGPLRPPLQAVSAKVRKQITAEVRKANAGLAA
jgi:4-hydroxy-2-oxoglutarate aldolase